MSYKQAEKKDNDTMPMKFLLHKDKEEMNIHRTNGTFGFADTQRQRKKPKEPEFLPTLDRKLIN